MRLPLGFLVCGVLAAPLLSGCGWMLENLEDANSFTVAAHPLCVETPGYAINDKGECTPTTKAATVAPVATKEYIGQIVNESEFYCSKFLNGLVLASNTANTGLDGFTTVFSALGTAFTPIATVHAFTAAGSISSGWKTAIDSDIYAKATVANYAQAIQATYYTDISAYLDALSNSNEQNLVASIEVAKIRAIHKECSLASAQASISASLQPAPAAAAATSDQTVTVTGVAADDVFALSGTASTLAAPLAASYKAKAGDSPATVAQALVGDIAGDPAFKAAGVTATATSQTSASFVLHSAVAVKWSVSGKLTISAQGASAVSKTSTTVVAQAATMQTPTVGTPATLAGTLPGAGAATLSLSVPVVAGDTAADVANNIVIAVTTDDAFKAAGVTAALQSKGSATFILTSPSAINWSFTGGPKATGAPSTSTTTTTSTSAGPGVSTKAPIPGHAAH